MRDLICRLFAVISKIFHFFILRAILHSSRSFLCATIESKFKSLEYFPKVCSISRIFLSIFALRRAQHLRGLITIEFLQNDFCSRVFAKGACNSLWKPKFWRAEGNKPLKFRNFVIDLELLGAIFERRKAFWGSDISGFQRTFARRQRKSPWG